MRGASTARTPLPGFLAIGILPIVFHIVIVETSHIRLALAPSFGSLFKLGFVTASALTHWGIYSSLLIAFALTLRPRHVPMVTALARRMQSDFPDELAFYTRRVTIAWCCFFATQLTLSITLFCFAPLVVWSFFVNILDLPLVAAMFAGEYMFRLRFVRNPPRQSLAMIVKMIEDFGKRPASSDAARPG